MWELQILGSQLFIFLIDRTKNFNIYKCPTMHIVKSQIQLLLKIM